MILFHLLYKDTSARRCVDANPLSTLMPCRRVTNHRPHDRVRILIDSEYLTMREGTPKQDIFQQGLPLKEAQHMPKRMQSLEIIIGDVPLTVEN